MASLKKGAKSKLFSEDLNELLNESQFTKGSPKTKKGQKRQVNVTEEEDLSKLLGQYQTAKKKKLEVNVETCQDTRQKILDVMSHQLKTRKEKSDSLLKNLSQIVTQLEVDCNVMKDNEKKLEHLSTAVMKCMEQATTAQKQKLKALKNIYVCFKKDVEGLVTRGAIRPDDRPLWFDVYRAFPPTAEPKFSKPKPEIKPLRQILYPEDNTRAMFHSNGHGLGAINILSQTTDTPTKRLVHQYEKLKAEGVPEDELIEKSAAAVGNERQLDGPKVKLTAKNPDSVTAQILAEADIKNIFKEN